MGDALDRDRQGRYYSFIVKKTKKDRQGRYYSFIVKKKKKKEIQKIIIQSAEFLS